MHDYEYSYEGAEFYCYPSTDVLINKFGIYEKENLSDAERKITRLKAIEKPQTLKVCGFRVGEPTTSKYQTNILFPDRLRN